MTQLRFKNLLKSHIKSALREAGWDLVKFGRSPKKNKWGLHRKAFHHETEGNEHLTSPTYLHTAQNRYEEMDTTDSEETYMGYFRGYNRKITPPGIVKRPAHLISWHEQDFNFKIQSLGAWEIKRYEWTQHPEDPEQMAWVERAPDEDIWFKLELDDANHDVDVNETTNQVEGQMFPDLTPHELVANMTLYFEEHMPDEPEEGEDPKDDVRIGKIRLVHPDKDDEIPDKDGNTANPKKMTTEEKEHTHFEEIMETDEPEDYEYMFIQENPHMTVEPTFLGFGGCEGVEYGDEDPPPPDDETVDVNSPPPPQTFEIYLPMDSETSVEIVDDDNYEVDDYWKTWLDLYYPGFDKDDPPNITQSRDVQVWVNKWTYDESEGEKEEPYERGAIIKLNQKDQARYIEVTVRQEVYLYGGEEEE